MMFTFRASGIILQLLLKEKKNRSKVIRAALELYYQRRGIL